MPQAGQDQRLRAHNFGSDGQGHLWPVAIVFIPRHHQCGAGDGWFGGHDLVNASGQDAVIVGIGRLIVAQHPATHFVHHRGVLSAELIGEPTLQGGFHRGRRPLAICLHHPRHNGRLRRIRSAMGRMQDGKRLGACRIILRKAAGDHAAQRKTHEGSLVAAQMIQQSRQLGCQGRQIGVRLRGRLPMPKHIIGQHAKLRRKGGDHLVPDFMRQP